MGRFVGFRCRFCKYEETGLGIGRGRTEFPFLKLYRCDNCKTIGSTWIYENRIPRCAGCYHDAITLLDDDARQVNCPKCGEPAPLTPQDGEWQ